MLLGGVACPCLAISLHSFSAIPEKCRAYATCKLHETGASRTSYQAFHRLEVMKNLWSFVRGYGGRSEGFGCSDELPRLHTALLQRSRRRLDRHINIRDTRWH